MSRTDRIARCSAVALGVLMLGGCGHLPQPHWPWHHKTPAAPEPVHELVITGTDGADAPYPQYWNRNTLVIDLQSAGSAGSISLKPREHTVWPVRIAFRVHPGQFESLEVKAQQRVVLPITATGSQPVELELEPGVFIMKSPQMTVSWGTHSSGT